MGAGEHLMSSAEHTHAGTAGSHVFGAGTNGRVVVVGAGLAGVLAACLFAKKGYQVAVFEKRDAGPPSVARSFPMTLGHRAINATAAAGLDPSIITSEPVCGGFKVLPGRSLLFPPWIQTHLVDRIKFGGQLVAAAQQQYPKEISFHFGYEVSELDLARRTVRVKAALDGVPDLGVNEVAYDLLVAADGSYSRVRSLCGQQDPELEVHVPMTSPVAYLSLQNLPAPSQDPWDALKPHDSRTFLRSVLPLGFGNPGMSFWQTPDGTFSALAVLPTHCKSVPDWVAGAVRKRAQPTAEQVDELKSLLADSFELIPEEWRELIEMQLPKAVFGFMGRTVWCSKFTSTGVLMLGDAAHGVTASLGQGANLAMEDVAVLSQILDESERCLAGGPFCAVDESAATKHLDAICATYERKRLDDAHAMQKLDLWNGVMRKWPVQTVNSTFVGSVVDAWQAFAYKVSTIMGMMASVQFPNQKLLLSAGMSSYLPLTYKQCVDRMQVQTAVLVAPLATVGVLLARAGCRWMLTKSTAGK